MSLCGCTVKKNIHMQDEIDTVLQQVLSAKIFDSNMNKPLYSYYLAPSIGRHTSTSISTVLNDHGKRFVMNLNVASITQKDDATSNTALVSFLDPVVHSEGEYVDSEEATHRYVVNIYEKNGWYMTEFTSDTVIFYAVEDALSSVEIVKDMMQIARSVKVNDAKVIDAYANRNTVNYKSEKIELFKQVVPESGRIEELFEEPSSKEDTSQRNEDGPKQFTNSEDVSE